MVYLLKKTEEGTLGMIRLFFRIIIYVYFGGFGGKFYLIFYISPPGNLLKISISGWSISVSLDLPGSLGGSLCCCCLLPYCLESLKEVRHSCPLCSHELGRHRE